MVSCVNSSSVCPDTLHAYHLDARNGASGGHTVWAATVLTPFVHTLAKHGFALRVRDELVASRQEALSVDELWEEMQSRLDDSALELSKMASVDVEAEPVGSNAGGAASVYATEMVVRMLKQAAAKSELNPAEVVHEVLRTYRVERQQYAMMRPWLAERLSEMSQAYQQAMEEELAA